MDKLLSTFTKMYINEFNESELVLLCNLLDLDDENLFNFNQGQKISIKIERNKVTNLFKHFIYTNK